MPLWSDSTPATVSPNRKLTDRSRRWYFSASTTSSSQKSEHPLPRLHHRHPGAECGEHRRVLDADHPGADHHHGRGISDRCMIPSESRMRTSSKSTPGGRAGRVPVAMTMCAAADHPFDAVVLHHRDRVLVDEPSGPADQRDVVAGELAARPPRSRVRSRAACGRSGRRS